MGQNFHETINKQASDRAEIACEADSHNIVCLLSSRCAARGKTQKISEKSCNLPRTSGIVDFVSSNFERGKDLDNG